MKRWKHPGGKLRELGAEALSDSELLAVVISSGVRGRSAETIAGEVVERYGSLAGMAEVSREQLLEFRGVSDVKAHRVMAALEIGRRLAQAGERAVKNEP
jgi:DNA repair protein RadC